jgi:hypothetical protein
MLSIRLVSLFHAEAFITVATSRAVLNLELRLTFHDDRCTPLTRPKDKAPSDALVELLLGLSAKLIELKQAASALKKLH